MKKDDIKEKILSEDRLKYSVFPLIHRISFAQMYRFGSPPDYNPSKDKSIDAMASRENKTSKELAYDILLENQGKNFIYAPLVNYSNNTFDVCHEMLKDKNTIMGLGDGGAHVGFILDAGYPTWLLSYWTNEKKLFSVEESIRRLTSDTAHAVGLDDRGLIKEGLKADINIIDLNKLSSSDPFMVKDLPANGKRLMQKTRGYVATIVSGKVTYDNGSFTSKTPGKLIKLIEVNKSNTEMATN